MPYIIWIQILNNIIGIKKNNIIINIPYKIGFNSSKYINKKNSDQNRLVHGNPKNKILVIKIIVVKLGANNHKELSSVIYRVLKRLEILSVSKKNNDDSIAWLKSINIADIHDNVVLCSNTKSNQCISITVVYAIIFFKSIW